MAGAEARAKLAEEDDINHHKLGDDFQGAIAFSVSEVAVLLQMKVREEREKGEEYTTTKTSVFEKTLAYCNTFQAPGVTEEKIAQVISTLGVPSGRAEDDPHRLGLTEFERAQIITLRPTSYEQAVELIPSLKA